LSEIKQTIRVHAVSVECRYAMRMQLADAIRQWVQRTSKQIAGAAHLYQIKRVERSVRTIEGGVNYLAHVIDYGRNWVDPQASATGMVLAAALRNEVLLDAIRTRGGAYGAGAQWQAGCLAMFSFRDPRAAATFADMEFALQALSDTTLTQRALYEAKLAALATLRRQWIAPQRKLTAAWQHFQTAGGIDGVADAIAATGSAELQALAGLTQTKPSYRFAWVSDNEQVNVLSGEGFAVNRHADT
jgi:Zn-dependent M16 (insulinase) family peptidase